MKKSPSKIIINSETSLYFHFHNKLWKGLIKKGFNLRSINFFYACKYKLKQTEIEEPWVILLIGIMNISLLIFPIKLWVGGAQRHLAFPIFWNKQITLVVIWLKTYSTEKRSINKSKLVHIIIESFYNKGALWQRKKELYDACIENRLFLKFLK